MSTDELNQSSLKLAREYRDFIRVFEVGGTRVGKPIYCIEIPGSENVSLWFGYSHPK